MYPKVFIFVLVSYSCAFMAFSLTLSGVIEDQACIQKLMPCQPYLKPPASPPATCCVPLKEMIVDDIACLCSIFDNKELLSKFNITQDDAFRLPKLCGAHANMSLCRNGTAAPGASPASPTASNSSAPSESTKHKKNAADIVAYSGGLSYFALSVLGLVFSAM